MRVDRIGQCHDLLSHGGDTRLVGQRDRAADENQARYALRVTYCHHLGDQAATRSADKHGTSDPDSIHEVDDVRGEVADPKASKVADDGPVAPLRRSEGVDRRGQ